MATETQSIILCGRSREVGQPVMDFLKPEYKVASFITSTEQAVEEIPAVLRGKDNVQAVVLGGGYDDDAFDSIRKAATGSDYQKVFWLRPDMSKMPTGPPGPGYAKAVAKRTKDKLDELRQGDVAEGELVLY